MEYLFEDTLFKNDTKPGTFESSFSGIAFFVLYK